MTITMMSNASEVSGYGGEGTLTLFSSAPEYKAC